MHTVFSHIVQKRFSQVNEDVATDALAFVLKTSESARNGMMRLLRGISPELPALRFKTQQTEGANRPDMWGYAGDQPRVFVENKFWAGLTDNQPVSYLNQLAVYPQPTVLLVIAPAAREQTLWRELNYRLAAQGILTATRAASAAVPCLAATETGPVLALTSWVNVLSVLEHECVDDPGARADLLQLRSLCDSADADAFAPVSRSEVTDQRAPAFILQLGIITQAAVDLAITRNAVSTDGLRPQASWDRVGRYVRLAGDAPGRGAGAWFGVHFGLWKTHGTTPLWLIFNDGTFGRGQEVRSLTESWATQNGILTVSGDNDIAIGLELPEGEEKVGVVRSLAEDLVTIAALLEQLPSTAGGHPAQEEYDETSP